MAYENERIKELEEENAKLVSQIKDCYDEFAKLETVINTLKKNLRRCEVQNNSLKTENDEFKRKFALIEGNKIGAFLVNMYRKYKHILFRH